MKEPLNKERLRRILSGKVCPTKLGAMLVTTTVKMFSDDYLRGVMKVDVIGESAGEVNLKLPVLCYLLRLLCEVAENDPIECKMIIKNDLIIRTTYPKIHDDDMASHVINIARLAGFSVKRDGDILVLKTKIRPRIVLPIFASRFDEFMDMLKDIFDV